MPNLAAWLRARDTTLVRHSRHFADCLLDESATSGRGTESTLGRLVVYIKINGETTVRSHQPTITYYERITPSSPPSTAAALLRQLLCLRRGGQHRVLACRLSADEGRVPRQARRFSRLCELPGAPAVHGQREGA
eukprot:6983956-Prymnesium_polylepis.2